MSLASLPALCMRGSRHSHTVPRIQDHCRRSLLDGMAFFLLVPGGANEIFSLYRASLLRPSARPRFRPQPDGGVRGAITRTHTCMRWWRLSTRWRSGDLASSSPLRLRCRVPRQAFYRIWMRRLVPWGHRRKGFLPVVLLPASWARCRMTTFHRRWQPSTTQRSHFLRLARGRWGCRFYWSRTGMTWLRILLHVWCCRRAQHEPS